MDRSRRTVERRNGKSDAGVVDKKVQKTVSSFRNGPANRGVILLLSRMRK